MAPGRKRFLLPAMAVLFFSACRGPYYFDLRSEPRTRAAGPGIDKILRVEDVGIDETYRDFRIVCRETPFRVAYHGTASWAKPPDELIGDAIVHFWRQRAAFRRVLAADREDDPDWVMRARVNAIEKALFKKKWHARLAMDVEIADAGSGKIVLAHSFDRSLALEKNRISLVPEKVSLILLEEMMKIEEKLLESSAAQGA